MIRPPADGFAPKTKAREALADHEQEALRAAARAAGGWRPLARRWPETCATTLSRAARGHMATRLALHVIHVPSRRAQVAA